jgi:hypothetical protein
MKHARLVFGLVLAALVAVALAVSLVADAPARPRPAGWRDEWAQLPLLKEGDWSLDPLERGVVQGEFFLASDQLAGCLQRYGGQDGAVVKLELLVETERGGTHFEYVEPLEARADLPAGLVPCLTRTLEQVQPLPTPGLAEDTRWRLEVNFLLPPLAELPRVPWWKRFFPSRRPGADRVG